jgi:hypothetical protein
MAEVTVEANFAGVNSFPIVEELHHHEDLVACYDPTREAVAAHVPAAEVLARLPLVRVFSFLYVFGLAYGASTPFVSDLL